MIKPAEKSGAYLKGLKFMRSLSLNFICKAVSGKMENSREDITVDSVCTDTRKIKPGCLFIALKGDRFDGHDFIESAFNAGAAAVVSQKPMCSPGGAVILVDDTARALLALAGAYRRLFAIPVVGITGSVGKTSTKEMVYAVLSQKYTTHKNEGNLNNQIGMPMSVFGLEPRHEAAVFEMGMSAFGEIENLSRVAAPSIGIITNIGISHIEKLKTRQNILSAKLELLKGMEEGSVLLLNGDDELLRAARKNLNVPALLYGINNKDCDVSASRIVTKNGATEFIIKYEEGEIPARIPVIGEHHVYNALAAFAAGRLLNIPPEDAVRGFDYFSQPGLRQKIVEKGGIVFIEDCYNASPDSMNAAFSVLKTVAGSGADASGRKIAVLADMLELGSQSAQAHRDVGKSAVQAGVNMLLAYGSDAANYCDGFRSGKQQPEGECFCFDNKGALAEKLAKSLCRGDTVLFKGSRAMKLEEAIEKTYSLLGFLSQNK